MPSLIGESIRKAALAERRRCALIARHWWDDFDMRTGKRIANRDDLEIAKAIMSPTINVKTLAYRRHSARERRKFFRGMGRPR